jgi:uncharacterized protein with gpF-like domain
MAMERFYENDPDDEKEPFFGDNDEDDDDDVIDEESDAVAFIDQQGIIDVMNMDLAQTELNQHLLSQAIEIAKQSWFWGFKSTDSRMKEIETIYKRLLKLTEEVEEPEDDIEEEE